ncbi:chloride channel protein [Pseudocolwellia sp. AS88]|uniref:chloride channel protein n=1 Tax=Pseudocolwellia sp. AS88 TaxID=3063958 RepID=UPI0026EE5F90|nr:chloride channel protein [Pseudocolwellia sp. AS88]MDO7084288.1 chloride channel protein [Pseudocolwellia sp. AS88]
MILFSLKKRLSLPITSWQLCLLASIGGALSAMLIVGFTMATTALQELYLSEKDNYNSINELSRFLLPIFGAIVILLVSWITGYKYLRTGIPFVLHRLKVAHGVIPLRNTIHQFIGSAIALASGFSVGREGPAIHLGAAFSGYLGSLLKLPHNSIRTLSACGVAAAISASFNTPVAAVIFVMEVILREYKVHIFIPIMMASLVGSMITTSALGPAHEFEYFKTIVLELEHYPVLILFAIGIGILSFGFNKYLVATIKSSEKYHIVSRLMLAALITSSLSFVVPQALGTNFGAIDFSISDNPSLFFLMGLLIAKLIMTISALGLGIPGGAIGPVLGIGAIAGSCAAVFIQSYYPETSLTSDFALMGMAGMMAATLNAPLAALITVVELSNQLEVIVPAMIIIGTSCIVSGQFFGNRSLFVMQLEIQNLIYRKPPLEKSLQRVGVLGVMNENFEVTTQLSEQEKQEFLSQCKDNYFLIDKVDNEESKSSVYYSVQYQIHENTENETNDNAELYHQLLLPLHAQATLMEVYSLLEKKRKGAVYIYGDNMDDVLGIITFAQVRRFLLEGNIN